MDKLVKTKVGQVVSNKMDKTVVVIVEATRRHPIYRKAIRRAKRYKAHCEKNDCSIGDTVRIIESRPLSKDKYWRVGEIITKAAVIEVRPEEIEPKPEAPEQDPGLSEVVAEKATDQ